MLPSVMGFVLLPLYTRFMSVADFGIVNSMQTFSGILMVFFTLALERSAYRVYYDYTDPSEKKMFFGTMLIGIFIASVIIGGSCFLFSSQIQKIFESISFYPFFALTILYTFCMAYFNVTQIIALVQHKSIRYFVIAVSAFFVTNLLSIYFVVFKGHGALGMIEGTAIGYGIMLPVCIFILKKEVVFSFRFDIFKNILNFCAPMLPILISAWISNLSDRIFIDHYFTQNEVGLYSLGYKIGSLILFIAGAFQMAYNPIFYELANSENQQEAKITLEKYNNIFIMVVSVMSLSIFLFCKEVIGFLFHERYAEAIVYGKIICVAFMISQCGGIFNSMIYQHKKTDRYMYIVIFCALVNLGLNYLLIPRFGPLMAPVTTLINSLLIFSLSFWVARKCYFIPLNWTVFFMLLSCFAVIEGLDYFSSGRISPLVVFVFKMILFLVISGGFVWYRKDFFLKLLNSKKQEEA